MAKFGEHLNRFLYDLFIKLLWFVQGLVSQFCVWGAVGPHSSWGWRGLCPCCVSRVPQWNPTAFHRHSAFGRASLLLAPWSFWELQEPECLCFTAEWGLWRCQGLKAIERNGWKPWRCLWCGHHSASSYLLFLGVASFPSQKYMGFTFFLYCSWNLFFFHFCFCKGINALFKCTS